MWASFAVYTGLNLGTQSQIWWANLSSASTDITVEVTRLKKDIGRGRTKEKKGAQL